MSMDIKQIGIVDVTFGKGVEVVSPANLYGCTLGDNVFIGPFVEIQKKAFIGDGTRIQSHTFICELVRIGENCVIGHGVMFINDLFTEKKSVLSDTSNWKPTLVGNRVYIGSNATILPVKICDNVIIGAGAVVTRDIVVPGRYAGNPAIKMPE
jgi:UDP-3-O-[3-hydroxymyristoyl] glucosamine N-acyltransferase